MIYKPPSPDARRIVSGILLAAGEARGENPSVTTVRMFLDEVVDEWRTRHDAQSLKYIDDFGSDVTIISDTVLKQVIGNVLENAAEASRQPVTFSVERVGDMLTMQVRDEGSGFTADGLRHFGKPYYSTKQRRGAGLGLFLVVNMMRKLGGNVAARNHPEGGAVVSLSLPLSVLEWKKR